MSLTIEHTFDGNMTMTHHYPCSRLTPEIPKVTADESSIGLASITANQLFVL